MKNKPILSVCLAACLCLVGAVCHAEAPVTLIVASDLHYLSPSITDYGDAFYQIIENADGKTTQYTPQIVQAFVTDMLAIKPDGVILSGDLTLNGAPASHQGMALLLSSLTSSGIPVYVLPGNHDIGSIAYSFGPEGAVRIPGTSAEDFVSYYAPFGYQSAVSRDEASLSYLARITDTLYLLAVDVNANTCPGTVSDETLNWVNTVLQDCQKKGAQVIGVSHQNLLAHNPLFTYGYRMGQGEKLLALYSKYGVKLNLSGHMHLQHIASSDGVTDIAVSALAIAPTQYAVLTWSNGCFAYRTQIVQVSEWAKQSGQADENLLQFETYAKKFFDDNTYRQVSTLVDNTPAGTEEKQQLIDFAVQLNSAYFSGTRTQNVEESTWALWQKYLPADFFTVYLSSILSEAPCDMSTWNLP